MLSESNGVESTVWVSDLSPEEWADLGCRLSRKVHDECKDTPHDIGIKLMRVLEQFLKDNVQSDSSDLSD